LSNETTELFFRKSLPIYVWYRKMLVLRAKNPFDYLVLGEYHNAFEIKESKRGRFSFKDDIKPHQYVGLLNFSNKGDNFRAFVFIRFKANIDAYYCIPIEELYNYRLNKSLKNQAFFDVFREYEILRKKGHILWFPL